MDDEQLLVAFGQLVCKNPKRAMLGRIIVCPALRRKGYGKELVSSLLEKAHADGFERVGLYVDCSNVSAIALYCKIGFRDKVLPADQPELSGARYMETEVFPRVRNQS
jgi:ribosomal protein S18 acetylase RimI-like enzyme